MLNSDMHVLIYAQDTCTYIRIYVYTYRYASSKSYSTDTYEYNQILADTYSTICNVPLCDVHVFVCICAYVVHMLCIYAHILFYVVCMCICMYLVYIRFSISMYLKSYVFASLYNFLLHICACMILYLLEIRCCVG